MLVAPPNGSKNAVKGLGFFVGTVLLGALGVDHTLAESLDAARRRAARLTLAISVIAAGTSGAGVAPTPAPVAALAVGHRAAPSRAVESRHAGRTSHP